MFLPHSAGVNGSSGDLVWLFIWVPQDWSKALSFQSQCSCPQSHLSPSMGEFRSKVHANPEDKSTGSWEAQGMTPLETRLASQASEPALGSTAPGRNWVFICRLAVQEGAGGKWPLSRGIHILRPLECEMSLKGVAPPCGASGRW